MNRLTKVVSMHNNEPEFYEANIDLYPKMMGYEYQQAEMDCINKLGQLEDIEEELGIDLITLFNVLKSHEVICKHERGIVYHETTLEKHIISGLAFDDEYYGLWVFDKFGDEIFYYTKDYGKTWALTREELEENE